MDKGLGLELSVSVKVIQLFEARKKSIQRILLGGRTVQEELLVGNGYKLPVAHQLQDFFFAFFILLLSLQNQSASTVLSTNSSLTFYLIFPPCCL